MQQNIARGLPDFATLVQTIRSHPRTQLLTFSIVTPKADIGFMLLTPDLHDANKFEKQLTLALGPDVLQPAYSYYSMTELSEYTTSEEEYKKQLLAELQQQQQGHESEMVLNPTDIEATEDIELRLTEWRQRMKKYNQDRLYPTVLRMTGCAKSPARSSAPCGDGFSTGGLPARWRSFTPGNSIV